jgi:hypothetical protein
MPRRAANVNLTDTRRAIRAFQLEGVDVRMTLQPGGAVVLEPTASQPADPAPDESPLDQWRSKRGQG